MFLAASYAPAFEKVNIYFVPSQWYTLKFMTAIFLSTFTNNAQDSCIDFSLGNFHCFRPHLPGLSTAGYEEKDHRFNGKIRCLFLFDDIKISSTVPDVPFN